MSPTMSAGMTLCKKKALSHKLWNHYSSEGRLLTKRKRKRQRECTHLKLVAISLRLAACFSTSFKWVPACAQILTGLLQ